MATFTFDLTITAESEHNAKVKVAVIKNLIANVSDKNFIEILYPKIQKDKEFFKKVAANPLLKML